MNLPKMIFSKRDLLLTILFLFLIMNKDGNCVAQTIDMSETLNEPYLYRSSFMKDKKVPDEKDTLVKVDTFFDVSYKNLMSVQYIVIDTQVYKSQFLVYKSTMTFKKIYNTRKIETNCISYTGDTIVFHKKVSLNGKSWEGYCKYIYAQSRLRRKVFSIPQNMRSTSEIYIYSYDENGNLIQIALKEGNDSIKVLKQLNYIQHQAGNFPNLGYEKTFEVNVNSKDGNNNNQTLTISFDNSGHKTYQAESSKYVRNEEYFKYKEAELAQTVSKTDAMHGFITTYILKKYYKNSSIEYSLSHLQENPVIKPTENSNSHNIFKFRKEDFYPFNISESEFKQLSLDIIIKSYSFAF